MCMSAHARESVTYVYVHVSVRTYTYVYICLCMSVCMCVHLCVSVCRYVHVCTCARTRACVEFQAVTSTHRCALLSPPRLECTTSPGSPGRPDSRAPLPVSDPGSRALLPVSEPCQAPLSLLHIYNLATLRMFSEWNRPERDLRLASLPRPVPLRRARSPPASRARTPR